MKDRMLYDPALIQRDALGQFWHPDLPFPEDGGDSDEVDISEELRQQGFTYTRVEGECPDDIVEGGADPYWAWLRAWEPEPPEGEGWLLACIADTEDGPCAWFVRRLETPA